jgi:cytochrome c-type biogenesis protein CcmH/NrfG
LTAEVDLNGEPWLPAASKRNAESRFDDDRRRRILLVFLITAAVVSCALALAAWRGKRDVRVVAGLGGLAVALSVTAWAIRPATLPGAAGAPDSWLVNSAMAFNKAGVPALQSATGPAAQAGSLPELAERLAARLAKSPDDPSGWSLLATTYRQLGRETEAAEAERRAIEAGADPATLGQGHPAFMGLAGATGTPAMAAAAQSPAAKYVIAGQRLKVQRKFHEAELEFRKAVEADPGDADSWADLADCAAVAAGHDLTVGREAIDRALAINPQHRKALWLRASLELQEGRSAAAAATWRTLSALVPPGSPDARVIAANIAEADGLAARAGG